ncbi:MAG: hypothetical protein ACPG51_20325 [Thiolinea sp.]
MMRLGKLAPNELQAMAEDIMQVFNSYSSITSEDLRLNQVEFSGNRKTGIEVFASDSAGNGLRMVKVTLNQAGASTQPVKAA